MMTWLVFYGGALLFMRPAAALGTGLRQLVHTPT